MFQGTTNDRDEQRQIDEQIEANRNRIRKGKWIDKGEKGTEEILNDNLLRKKRILKYQTNQDRDGIWEQGS